MTIQHRNLVLERVEELTVAECHQLDRLAFTEGAPIIEDDLTEVLERAIAAVDPDKIIELATRTSRSLELSQCHDRHRVGALTCAWAAAIATAGWRHITPEDVTELTWRWQAVTGQKITSHIHNCQEARGVTRSFDIAAAAEAIAVLMA